MGYAVLVVSMPTRPQKSAKKKTPAKATVKSKNIVADRVAKATRLKTAGATTRFKGHQKASAARAQAKRDSK